MKNIPKTIYLQIGEHVNPEDDFTDLDDEERTWSSHRVWESDIEYYRKKKLVAEDVPEFHENIAPPPLELYVTKLDGTKHEVLAYNRSFKSVQLLDGRWYFLGKYCNWL